ncbi:MAG: indole-3-glycerol phosphate synthase TrpC [Gemmatales bacterium]|nr:indole-3-glycerol phosphate synthase TrpC [Gemmatales bacterium]MDW8175733.1 indole-3-glycerol phosphate synthase TrpC [Gemmatales bacterium]
MSNILEQIVAHKQRELMHKRANISWPNLVRQAEGSTPPRGFRRALAEPPGVQIIAEVKRASPSAGMIQPQADALTQARLYAQGGAACLSVLTDERYFHGSLHDLEVISSAVSLPVLRKDFVLDVFQVVEARAAGADAVLLIAEILDDKCLRRLFAEIRNWGMDALVEFYLPENLPRVLDLGADLVGINNRNLRTFQTNLEHSLKLARSIPSHVCLVSESGIRNREDIVKLAQAGVKAVLIGETLMRSADPVLTLRELTGHHSAH